MKKMYTLFAAIIIVAAASAQWTKVSTLSYTGGGGLDTARYCRDIKVNGVYLYAASDIGLFLSADNGITWTNVTGNNSTTKGKDDLNSIGILTVSSATKLFIGGKGYIFSSVDNGTTWTNVSTGVVSTADIKDFAQIGNTLFAAYNTGSGGGVYISADGGATWAASNTGIPGNAGINRLLADGSTIYAGGGPGVYASADNGATWTSKSTGLPASPFILGLVKKGTDLYAGSASGSSSAMFKSADNGTSWSAITSGLPTGFCQIFDILVHGNDLYIAEDGNPNPKPIYLSADDGVSWTAFDTGLPSGFFAPVLGQNADGTSLFTFKGFSGDIYRTGSTVTGTISLSEKAAETNIFPNPFNTSAILEISSSVKTDDAEMALYDLLGQEVRREKINGSRTEIKREKLMQGAYLYTISTSGNMIKTGKLIIQ